MRFDWVNKLQQFFGIFFKGVLFVPNIKADGQKFICKNFNLMLLLPEIWLSIITLDEVAISEVGVTKINGLHRNINIFKHIICHSEGCKLGIASNHGDVMHWFPKHGKSMDTFRAAVKVGLAATEAPAPVTPTTPKKYYRVQVGAYSVKSNADAMLARIKAAGFTDAFVKYSE